MSQASLLSPAHQSPVASSRLVRFLVELLDADVPVSHQRFIERLGQSFDLADSIKISAAHDLRPADVASPAPVAKEAIKAEFQSVRASIISNATQSFGPGASSLGSGLRFPGIREEMTDEEILSPERYMAFYITHQRNVDFRVRDLHARTREELALLSPSFARLAALDEVLAGPLTAPARKAFAAVPRLLRQRFEALMQEHQNSTAEQTTDRTRWEPIFEKFRVEMQGLLLAEIETRLLPTLGLIEALDEKGDD